MDIFDELTTLVDSKAEDYADFDNVFSNFEGAAKIAGTTVEQVFMMLIGVKTERLRQLYSGKAPNHESVDDTLKDLANYSALLIAYRRQSNPYAQPGPSLFEQTVIAYEQADRDAMDEADVFVRALQEYNLGRKTRRETMEAITWEPGSINVIVPEVGIKATIADVMAEYWLGPDELKAEVAQDAVLDDVIEPDERPHTPALTGSECWCMDDSCES